MNIVNVEKRLIDKLVDECNENIDEEIETVSEGKGKFVYCKYINHNKENVSQYYNYVYQKKININGRN